ncbi:hypothetical protein CICLE_v10013104mg [Citrus x clementina]|uniref:Uncharacterized protein n=1 Tax=Citrus clementina TaxID=85681 RepID=V4UTF5_CITCL|nr:hypothetical protein CICLE_v10013104mg [Citrus x clementina]
MNFVGLSIGLCRLDEKAVVIFFLLANECHRLEIFIRTEFPPLMICSIFQIQIQGLFLFKKLLLVLFQTQFSFNIVNHCLRLMMILHVITRIGNVLFLFWIWRSNNLRSRSPHKIIMPMGLSWLCLPHH